MYSTFVLPKKKCVSYAIQSFVDVCEVFKFLEAAVHEVIWFPDQRCSLKKVYIACNVPGCTV